jgi:hypothetical protein
MQPEPQPDQMPLDSLQKRVARTALALPEARSLALAGGGAMIVHGFVTRETQDVDLFTELDDDARQRDPLAPDRRTDRQAPPAEPVQAEPGS